MKKTYRLFWVIVLQMVVAAPLKAQLNSQAKSYTRADTLRGSLNEARNWWDVQHYAVYVEPDYDNKTIKGKVDIRFKVLSPGKTMQIDLQEPMQLGKAYIGDKPMTFKRDGNTFFINVSDILSKDSIFTLALQFQGNVTVAKRPPWDGGWIFSKDKLGRPWMSVACQGLGASVWFPCKDHQSDEPDQGSTLKINVPDSLMAVGNGRLISKEKYRQGWTAYQWEVKNPINNYNIIPYIGKYVSFSESYPGEKGKLDCDYWVLDYNLDKAKKQFAQVKPMLQAFEHWFGPYPFYEDGFKLVESPHLGMEHQSAVAYGNGFQNGYRGRDLSGSGWGLNWDFIIVHESGHEWFGNNITTKEVADMWVHEGFTNYSETIFTTHHYGKEAGNAYVQGTRKLVQNDLPIIGKYGVNEEGSGDMYYKGGNLVHLIRQLFDDDEKFRMALREMNKRFYHTTTTSAAVEQFWSEQLKRDLSPLFDQYLRSTKIPTLQIEKVGNKIKYRWADCNNNFNIPLRVIVDGNPLWIEPTITWKTFKGKSYINSFEPDKNFYVGFAALQ
ncbi:MAG: M1 family metallopeptidase [bacterium]|jgi:aminopeptidase N